VVNSSGIDSRRYQSFWEVVGLERGSLSLVSTIEELLGRNSSGSGLESREYGLGIRWAHHAAPFCPQKLALTSPTSGDRSVGIVRCANSSGRAATLFLGKWLLAFAENCLPSVKSKPNQPALWTLCITNNTSSRAQQQRINFFLNPDTLWRDSTLRSTKWREHRLAMTLQRNASGNTKQKHAMQITKDVTRSHYDGSLSLTLPTCLQFNKHGITLSQGHFTPRVHTSTVYN
jgi:hypothetical protein